MIGFLTKDTIRKALGEHMTEDELNEMVSRNIMTSLAILWSNELNILSLGSRNWFKWWWTNRLYGVCKVIYNYQVLFSWVIFI